MNVKETILKGIPICRGVAIGKPYFFSFVDEAAPESSLAAEHIEKEVQRYRDAIFRSKQEIQLLQKQLEHAHMTDGASILDAQLNLLQDPALTTAVEDQIRLTKKNAEAVFQAVLALYQKKFVAISDPFFRERFKDVQDISRRVISHLRTAVRHSLSSIPPESVIFSRELTTTDAAEANMLHATAFVTELEGSTSHAAIVARSRGTPYVSSIDISRIDVTEHKLVIVDGRTGEVILNPSADTLTKYQMIKHKLLTHMVKLNQTSALKAETYDGYPVRLSANIEMANELETLHQHGGHGVGLYRSEYIFLSLERFPTEEEQYEIYRDLVVKMHGLPIVIRTFDIGGDKQLPSQQNIGEGNPFLGCRAIRFLLKEREIFKNQLRAILRASACGDVSILFPMVSTVSEMIEAKSILKDSQDELRRLGIAQGEVRIGCMIEVPSAAIIADLLAKECDFLSIGTNDLVQYALAVDRGSPLMNPMYTPTHPSMIRLIKLIVHEANLQGVPVTMCGEVAADPRFTPLLLGLGVQEFSVATRYISAVKHAVRNTSIIAANRLAEKILTLTTANEIQALLTQVYQSSVPEDCLYNC